MVWSITEGLSCNNLQKKICQYMWTNRIIPYTWQSPPPELVDPVVWRYYDRSRSPTLIYRQVLASGRQTSVKSKNIISSSMEVQHQAIILYTTTCLQCAWLHQDTYYNLVMIALCYQIMQSTCIIILNDISWYSKVCKLRICEIANTKSDLHKRL